MDTITDNSIAIEEPSITKEQTNGTDSSSIEIVPNDPEPSENTNEEVPPPRIVEEPPPANNNNDVSPSVEFTETESTEIQESITEEGEACAVDEEQMVDDPPEGVAVVDEEISIDIVDVNESTANEDEEEEELEATPQTDEVPANEGKAKPKPRGRKFRGQIPLHVLGRQIVTTQTGISNGDRIMPKPRLGVKVPYKNLTSQIVSKAEIQEVIMERMKQKQESTPTQAQRNFARNLTKRLSKKLNPISTGPQKKKKKQSNSSSATETELIAMLEEMDNDPQENEEEAEEEGEVVVLQDECENDEKSTKKSIKTPTRSPPKDIPEDMNECEPGDRALKTYPRKRNSFDDEISKLIKKPLKFKSPDSKSETAYMTKSSRIIKKKIIWDPDDGSPTKKSVQVKDVSSLLKKEKKPTNEPTTKPIVTDEKTTSTSPNKGKVKRLSEVDRLLMDEGAVNMLYDVNNGNDSASSSSSLSATRKSGVQIQDDLISKANMVKNDLQQNVTCHVTLRKKDANATAVKKTSSTAPTVSSNNVEKKRSIEKKPVFSDGSSASYGGGADASRIIRRRSSSSSFSSGDNGSDFDYVPKDVSKKKSIENTTSTGNVPKRKTKKSSTSDENCSSSTTGVVPLNKEGKFYHAFNVSHVGKMATVQFNDGYDSYLNAQILKELTACLRELENNENCRLVVVRSTKGRPFCLGIDYNSLIGFNNQDRKTKAESLAVALRNYFKCLLNYSKIIIAAVESHCSGLGVTMLPLFDIVIAVDKSTFSTPYTHLNCLAEGAIFLSPPFTSSRAMASGLLFSSKIMNVTEAIQMGLITKRCGRDKFEDELSTTTKGILQLSQKGTATIKKHFRDNYSSSTESAINTESQLWIEQWISPECQKSFSTFVKIT